jgi:HK97 family phage major capsid protein
MSLLKKLMEQRNDKVATIEATSKLAEGRNLNETESGEVDSLIKEVEQLDAQIERQQKIESLKKSMMIDRHNAEEPQAEAQNFKIPAKAKARHKLKAFSGPDAERDAFVAGQFALAVRGREESREWLQNHGYGVNAAMSSTQNDKGGYLIPDVLEATIVRLVEEYGVLRRNVGRVWPLTNGNLNVPKRAGGFTFQWVGERGTINDSEPTLERVNLLAKKGAMLARVPSELFEDSIVSLGDFLATEMAYAKALAEDQAGFNGDGTSAFGGIKGLKTSLLAGAKSKAPNSDGQTTIGGLKITTFLNAMAQLKQYPGIAPRWYMSAAVFNNAAKRLAFAAGGTSVADFENGMRPSFLGYPVEITQVLPGGSPSATLADTIVAYFGDLSMAVAMGDSRDLRIVADESRYFETDEIGIRGTCRLDINVHETGTSTEGGAVIAVETAAS